MSPDTRPNVNQPCVRPQVHALGAVLLALLALLAALAPLHAQSRPARGIAEVAVFADLAGGAASTDKISIRIVKSTDRAILTTISEGLAEKFNTVVVQPGFEQPNRDIVTDNGIGLNFRIPVVPRNGSGYLPIAPFIETFAPYVSKLHIVYIIQGPFTYRGYQEYTHRDVRFTVDQPETSPEGAPIQLAFYGISAIIDNPNLENGSVPATPAEGAARTQATRRLIALVIGMGLIGAAIGLILSLLLRRNPAAAQGNAVKGDTHD